MKKIIVITLVFALVLSMSACGPRPLIPELPGGGSAPSSSSDSPSDSSSGSSSSSSGQGSGSVDLTPPDPKYASNGMSFDSIDGMIMELNRLSLLYSDAFKGENVLLAPGLTITGAVPFIVSAKSKLNNGNEDGRFGDLDSKNGFYEKNGNRVTIGRDWIADSSDAAFDKGDRLIWNGEMDLSKGWAWAEYFFQRDGKTYRTYRWDMQITTDGVVALNQEGFSVVQSNKTNTFTAMTESSLTHVKASIFGEVKNPKGPMRFDATMSTADAKAMFQSEGFDIRDYFKVEGGTLTEL